MVSRIANAPRFPQNPRYSKRRGFVFGCGGPVGAAYSIAALYEVERALGVAARDAHLIVGTSAGAEIALCVGSGATGADLLAAALGDPSADRELASHFGASVGEMPRLPEARLGNLGLARRALSGDVPLLAGLSALVPIGRGDASWLDRLAAARLRGSEWVSHPRTWIVAMDADSGSRVAFGSEGAPPASLGEALRASWAIPVYFPTVSIGGRAYADGGILSPTSLDLVLTEDLDEVVVIAPMVTREPVRRRGLGLVEQLLRASMTRTFEREVDLVRSRGTRVVTLTPGADDLDVMGPRLLDARRRYAVLESSLRTCRRAVRRALDTSARYAFGPRSSEERRLA